MNARPLAYNSICITELQSVLERYQDQSHQQIITDFEAALRELVTIGHVVALNSGTSALHLALKALDIGPGDFVIAPTFTYVATINPIVYVGAEPILVDCEEHTWNMDPDWLEQAILDSLHQKRKVKAIILVHTYGMPAQLEEIVSIAARYEIPLVEDAAESLGSLYKGQMTGTFGRIGVLSFNNNKIVTTYGGGAILTRDEELAARIRWLSQQARDPLPYYEHREVGYNYAMGPLNAAQGILQLPKLASNIQLRRAQFEAYQRQTSWEFQNETAESHSNRWLISALLPSPSVRESLQQLVLSHGWDTRRLWRPMHQQPVFKKYPFYGSDVSDRFFERGICLPTGENLEAITIQSFVTKFK